MDQEQSWLNDQDEEDSPAERYRYFLRPEPRQNLGPIYEVDDELTGKRLKCRDLSIGMVRNAKEENKLHVRAYLEPMPHTRVEKAKDLQGWYQSKNNIDPDTGKAHRPRPCFSEAILTSPYQGYCSVGCHFSLPAGALVDCPEGLRKIESIRIGDKVFGRTEYGVAPTKVTGISQHLKPEGYIELAIGNGTRLRLTADHPVWSAKCLSWVPADGVTRVMHISGSSYSVDSERSSIVPGEIVVYDIQTESENFYHNGILVHNCYVNSGMRGYRGSGLVVVPMNYGEQIKRQLTKVRRAAAGYFSSFTDPFLPLEDLYHNTQNAATEFVNVGLPIFFLSRLRYPEWAVDLLKENPHSYAQKSINTPDPDDWRLLSPGALPLEEHFEDIARLHDAGIYVSIQCNPILPGVTSNAQVLQLFRKLRDAGADHVIVKFVEAGYSWAPTMVEKTIKRFGDRGREFEKLFTDNIGGQKTIEESYRLKAHKLFKQYATQLGLSFSVCYEFKYARDEAGNIIDKTGVSIGREFATSEQCHGKRCPVYTRFTEEELFQEVEACPPSGCLHCASENDGKPRCGDELAGEANAVTFKDMKVPIGEGKARNPGLVQLGVKNG